MQFPAKPFMPRPVEPLHYKHRPAPWLLNDHGCLAAPSEAPQSAFWGLKIRGANGCMPQWLSGLLVTLGLNVCQADGCMPQWLACHLVACNFPSRGEQMPPQTRPTIRVLQSQLAAPPVAQPAQGGKPQCPQHRCKNWGNVCVRVCVLAHVPSTHVGMLVSKDSRPRVIPKQCQRPLVKCFLTVAKGHSDKSVRLLMPACFCKIGVGPCVHEANHGRFLHAHPSHLTYSTRFQQIPNTWETTHRHTFVPKEPPGRMPVGVPGPRPQLPWMNDGTTYNNHFDPKVR
eukprot:1142033-Pelagomonas_calceolata.AAC.3